MSDALVTRAYTPDFNSTSAPSVIESMGPFSRRARTLRRTPYSRRATQRRAQWWVDRPFEPGDATGGSGRTGDEPCGRSYRVAQERAGRRLKESCRHDSHGHGTTGASPPNWRGWSPASVSVPSKCGEAFPWLQGSAYRPVQPFPCRAYAGGTPAPGNDSPKAGGYSVRRLDVRRCGRHLHFCRFAAARQRAPWSMHRWPR